MEKNCLYCRLQNVILISFVGFVRGFDLISNILWFHYFKLNNHLLFPRIFTHY